MSVNLYNATTDTLKNVAGDIINPKSVNNTIAPTEETTTASRAYNVGEQFFLNDVLYKATSNIAQGDTITVGTNCTASDKLTEQIDATVEKWSGTDSGNTYVTVDKLAYDLTNETLGLKVDGADTVIPFKGVPTKYTRLLDGKNSYSGSLPNDYDILILTPWGGGTVRTTASVGGQVLTDLSKNSMYQGIYLYFNYKAGTNIQLTCDPSGYYIYALQR